MTQLLKTCCANTIIVVVLALMLLQAWPGVPIWLSWGPTYVADLLGLSQGTWSMFTPDPDNENHRLGAIIEYEDGLIVEWESPYWPDQNSFERFAGHRRSEYIDAMRNSMNSGALDGLAAWLARTQRQDGGTLATKRVEIFVKHQDIPDPRLRGWKLREGPPTYSRRTELYR
jgi:hypothetical protein